MGKVARSIRNNILVGLALVTPVVLTGVIVNWMFKFATNRLLPDSLKESQYDLLFRAAALLAVIVLLFFVGLFVRNIVGKKLYQFGDLVLTRIPFINKVYISVRQISEAIVAQRQNMFQEVVVVEYPRKGLYTIAFITADVPAGLRAQMARDKGAPSWVSLFIPTTPNPTSGYLIFVPRSDVTVLDMSVGDAMKLIISGGAAYPGTEMASHPTLLEKLEAWRFGQIRIEDVRRENA